ncbi:MAG: hypothetical protein INF52_06910 [Rhodobacter sp.]|nr:hypothetical protein [Rhodobacter sp.]
MIGDVRDAGGVFANLPGRTVEAFEAADARLARLSRTIAGGAQTVPVPDGAGWQGAKALKVPDTIPLMPLAPHAPRINPVGNVRACLRASRRAICVSETCGDIVARCCNAWNFFAKDITSLRSIPARDDAKAVKVQGRWSYSSTRRASPGTPYPGAAPGDCARRT